MNRGFACVSLVNPKCAGNVGSVLRACYAYGAAQINISGSRYPSWANHCTNTPKAHKHIPTFTVDSALDYIPMDTKIVAVDLVDEAIPLPSFKHPERAAYVFGPEDGTLGNDILEKADYRIMVPTSCCMNLAACVNVVLYDRMAKGAPFDVSFPKPDNTFQYKRKNE